jgi:ubiquinone/menaquinone biosynthesis C-methylase UbiE
MGSGISIEKAVLYEKYRLPYADEMVDGLLEHIDQVEVIADIGAGTGQLARMFADKSAKVYAVEPAPAMREVASVSLADLTTVEIIDGCAEQTTLAESSVDLIVVGNAFHRFKPEACTELQRILKERGWIALVRYVFNNKAFTDMLFSELAALEEFSDRVEKAQYETPLQDLFGEGQIYTLSYRQLHVEEWTAFFGAACAGIETPESADQDFVKFEEINRQVFDTFAVDGKIQIDYETRVLFGQPL